jgi:hypothetical protein
VIRLGAVAALLALAACGKAPDPAAAAGARDIDAGMLKAVDDTDAARREATTPPRPLAAPGSRAK